MTMNTLTRRALMWACGLGLTSLAMAQTYPAKPIKLVVGYAAGGAVDIIARTVGQSMAASMGQAVVVENKPGAGTNIAVKSVIAAEPDGYTLMMAANALAANMSLYQPQPFDAEKDLLAVSLVVNAFWTSSCSFCTIGLGVPAGATMPYQTEASNPGKPDSAMVGTSG